VVGTVLLVNDQNRLPNREPQMSQRRPNSPSLVRMESPDGPILFAVGGFSEDSDGLTLEYLKQNSSWLTGPGLPYPVSFSSAVVIGLELFVIGGEHADGISDNIFSLNCIPRFGKWKSIGKMRFPRYQHESVSIENQIWTFGGSKFNYGTTRFEILKLRIFYNFELFQVTS